MFADAERYFYNPEANNLIAYIHPVTGEKTSLFMSGEYRPDCKYESNLAEYLIKEGVLDPSGDYKELLKIPISVSDKAKALELIKEERLQKSKDPDQTEYLKQVMYFPIEPSECFLSTAKNFYNPDIARVKREKLENSEYKPMYVELIEEGDKVIFKDSKKLPVSSYPTKVTENKDAPICILEHPIPSPPYGLYVAGIDPFRFADAKYSDSLGAVYIFKRMYDVQGDTYQDMFVAWYVANPKEKTTWNNQARLLLKYYNAQGLCENDEYSFCDYMISKGDGHLLMDTPEWLREYIPTSGTLSRPKGISRQSEKVQLLLRTNFKQYMEEPFMTIPKEGEKEGKKILGVEKINDPVLLLEVEKFNPDGNFDRCVAAELAVTAAKKMDQKQIKIDTIGEDPRFKVTRDKKGNISTGRSRGMFPESKGIMHTIRKQNIFK